MTAFVERGNSTILENAQSGSPDLMRLAVLFMAGFAATTCLGLWDDRLLNGVSVWEKPAKFYLSLAVHAATLAWGLSLLAHTERTSPAIHRAVATFAFASIGEMIWITLQAARGQASHFNDSSLFHMTMYALMGLGAITLTGVTLFIGYRILRRGEGMMAYATGSGFVLAAIMTTLAAGYMSQQTGHAIGGNQTDAGGLPFFHWSTTGGDLRVAHFAALHIAQAIPFIGWILPDRNAINLALAVSVAIVAALLWQALSAIPFLAM